MILEGDRVAHMASRYPAGADASINTRGKLVTPCGDTHSCGASQVGVYNRSCYCKKWKPQEPYWTRLEILRASLLCKMGEDDVNAAADREIFKVAALRGTHVLVIEIRAILARASKQRLRITNLQKLHVGPEILSEPWRIAHLERR